MTIFHVIQLLGGLAFFLYGMHVLSAGLERMAGGKLEGLLKRITSNRFKALLLGAGITAAIQSSSAVTVMLVGLVNSGIMTIGQSVGVIMGSNIGTTMTAWILTLVGVESNNLFMQMLKPDNFSLLFAFIGILLTMGSKKQKRKDMGTILVAFAVLMYGMKLMSGAVKPLETEPAFMNLFTAFRNPILGVLVGVLVTAVIQSSSASVGILQALALTGAISYGAAIPIIMGQNIGTCVTAMISSMGVTKNAQKVAVVHITFNLIGTTLCLVLFYGVGAFVELPFMEASIDAVGIALVHTAFNLFTTTVLLPFTKQIEWIANRLLPDQAGEKKRMLDERLMATPSIAIAECDALAKKMAGVAMESMSTAISLLTKFDQKKADAVYDYENQLDKYEDTLGTYLVKLSSKRLSEEDSLRVSKILHSIGDFERLGDHALNIKEAAQELQDKGLVFSQNAQREVAVLSSAIEEIMSAANQCYTTNDPVIAANVEPLEEIIDNLVDVIKAKHIQRLQAGECSIELGFILSDLLTNFERISDHCSNIGVTIIELSHNTFDTHKYLKNLKADNASFKESYEQYAKKYSLGDQ